MPPYVIVSPVKDEERYVELTIMSVIGQTIKPALWIIVDDGSRDRTPEIVSRYADSHPFIRLVRNPRAGKRVLACAEVRAFNWGCELIGRVGYEYIVKLDCDLSFEKDYFEKLLERFRCDDRLGIASGIYQEKDMKGEWNEIAMPPYHAAGASKVMRKKCFGDIGGFVTAPGWDTIDEIRALSRGWKTCHFNDLRMKHHKREGSSVGVIKTTVMQGEAYYRSGGSKIFFLFKVLHRATLKPYIVNGLGMVFGYSMAMIGRKQLLVTDAEARNYKGLLLKRLIAQAKSIIGIR